MAAGPEHLSQHISVRFFHIGMIDGFYGGAMPICRIDVRPPPKVV